MEFYGLAYLTFQKRCGYMSDYFWLNDVQIARPKLFGLKSQGKRRIDDRRLLSGIIFINRIEIMLGRLNNWRRVTICYDRLLKVFMSAIVFAAIVTDFV